jgi:creatinine amidohydrolase
MSVKAGQSHSGRASDGTNEVQNACRQQINPELVRDGCQDAEWIADDRRLLLTTGMWEYTCNGVIGQPSAESAEKGKAVLAALVCSSAPALNVPQWTD